MIIGKVKNLFIYIFCLLIYIFRGKANNFLEEGDFLVVQPAKLGDMVCTTPVFRALKLSYPESRVIVMGDKINKELLADNPYVDEHIIYDKSFWNIISILKKKKIRAAFLVTPHFAILSILYLAGIKFIVCPMVEGRYSPYMTRTYKRLGRLVAINSRHRMKHYAPLEYLNMLKTIGIENSDTKKVLRHSSRALESVLDRWSVLKENYFFIGIAPGAGNVIKEWPADRFGKLANWLLGEYKSIYIFTIGSEKDKNKFQEMIKQIDESYSGRIMNTVGKLSIDELKSLISRMNLFVSADTGPIYIAEAFGIPTVDIVGPVDENEQPPMGEKHRLVVPERKQAELFVMDARSYSNNEAKKQVKSILIDDVKYVVKCLLDDIYEKG